MIATKSSSILFTSLVAAVLVTGVSCSRKKDKPAVTGIAATVDATLSTIESSIATVLADGAATAQLTIHFKSSDGEPVPGVVPQISISGDNNSASSCPATDIDGRSICTFTSTKAQSKQVGIYWPIQKSGAPVNFVAGSASQVCLMTNPGGGTAGQAWAQQPQFFIGDQFCNIVLNSTASVTVSKTTGAGTLSGTLTQASVAGVATFTDLSMELSGADKVLSATSPGLVGVPTAAFAIVGAEGASLIFATQPGGGGAGAAWDQQPVVQVLDAFGNIASSSATVFLTVASGTGALSGAVSRNAVGGVVSFAGLSIDLIGNKTIHADSAGLTPATSASFEITAGPAARLAFVTQPGGGSSNSVWAQQPAIEVQDGSGNRVLTATSTITLDLPGAQGQLAGTRILSATNGLVSFTDLSIDQVGPGKILTASSPGLVSADSDPFAITAGLPTHLCFLNQPGNSQAGSPFPSQPIVIVADSQCNIVTTASHDITLSVSNGSGLLVGAATVTAVNGQAIFTGLSLEVSGDKRLGASAPGLITAQSEIFTVQAGPASHMVFSTQPGGGLSTEIWAAQPIIEVQDEFGNQVASNHSITLSLESGTGALSGILTRSTSSGLATFSGLSMDLVGGDKSLRAVSAGLPDLVSNIFVISVGPAVKLSFNAQPGGGMAAQVWGAQPVVQVLDAGNNLVSDSTALVSLSISTGTGALSGTSSLSAVSGVASFLGLSIDLIGTGKQLTASSVGLASAISDPFDITQGPPTRLCFQSEPSDAIAGIAFPTQPIIKVADEGCNAVVTASDNITLTLTSGTGALLGVSSAGATAGVVAFSGLSMEISGIKRITASAAGLTSVESPDFTISHATPSVLVMVTPPSDAQALQVFPTQPVVEVRDTYGNLADSSSLTVDLAISSGTGLLSGASSVAANNGVASFAGLSINLTGLKQITASGSAVSSAVSTNFNISPAAASQLAFSTQPGGGTAGLAWSQQPVVEVQDAAGNRVTSATNNIALALTTGTGVLSGTSARAAVAGLANFTDLSINLMGTNKVLTATSAGLTSAVSSPAFVIVPNIPSASISTISANPTTLFADGSSISTVEAQIKDQYGNDISGKSVSLSSSRGATDSITGSPATTNIAGQVSFTVRSSTAGSSILTAQIPSNSVSLSTTPTLTFESYLVDIANSSWSVAPVTVAADGASTGVVNVVLRNSNNVALPGKSVTLVSSRGGTDSILSSPAVSNASGEVTFMVSSATRGESNLTISVPADSATLTSSGKINFYDLSPAADWQARLANSSVDSMLPGANSPSTSSWVDLTNLGPNNGALSGFNFTTTSGWCGSGVGAITNCTNGPYRLALDGTNDSVNFGTNLNSLSSVTQELWIQALAPTSRGNVIFSNGDGDQKGLTIRQAWEGSGKLELTAGSDYSFSGEVIADNPTVYFKLDETTGTTATRNVGSNNGTYTSGPVLNQASALFDGRSSVQFDGTNDYINVANVYEGTTNHTVEAFVYPTSFTNTRAIVSKYSGTRGFSLEIVNSRARFVHRSGSGTFTVNGATTLVTNTWYHIVGVRDSAAGRLRVYVNGVEDGNIAINGAVGTSTSAFVIGRKQTGNYFSGRIDEVATYATALSPARIAAHYAARLQRTCYSTAAIPASSWRQVAAIFDNSTTTLRLHMNGNATADCTFAGTGLSIEASTVPLSLGAQLDTGGSPMAGSFWQGLVGDARVYGSALTGAQINSNFNATSGRFP